MRQIYLFCLLMAMSFTVFAFDGGWVARLPNEAQRLTQELEISSVYLNDMQSALKAPDDIQNTEMVFNQAISVLKAYSTFNQKYQQYKGEKDETARQTERVQLKMDMAGLIELCAQSVRQINVSVVPINSHAIVIQSFSIRTSIDALKANLSHWNLDEKRDGF